jgi:drug/metabolite transporter (DMT)-like permease
MSDPACRPSRPALWSLALAFGLVYVSWGTTFYVIRAGVHDYHLPPALFGGVRVALAGVCLLAFLALRGEPLRFPGREFAWVVVAGLLMFVGGNGLLTFALDPLPSSVAAVLGATMPLWMAVVEWFWPGGERLGPVGWLGLFVGLGGVLLLLLPDLRETRDIGRFTGLALITGSSGCWAIGSVVIHHKRSGGSHLAAAAYQMLLGGGSLAVLGLLFGEAGQLNRDMLTAGAIGTFVYLLLVGSLVGFVAFNWLLGHVSTPLVGTYAYVNPLMAVLVGHLLGHEALTGWLVGGLVIILAGVALVRGGGRQSSESVPPGVGAKDVLSDACRLARQVKEFPS